MNKERILQLADHVEKLSYVSLSNYDASMGSAFTMQRTRYYCGAPACLAGHAILLFGSESPLGLTPEQTCELFIPVGFSDNPEAFTPEQAARTLRNLVETGDVNWNA